MTNHDVTRHNPAPWRAERNLIVDAEGKPVSGLVLKRMHSESEFMILDAINNKDELEDNKLRAIGLYDEKKKECDRLRAVNAELVAALERLLKAADNSTCSSIACDAARAALAKAKP